MSSAQPHVRTAYGIDFLLSRHKDIRRLKKEAEEPSIHGNKFWGSSYLIMDYLENNPIKENCRVLELGCGWGLAGIHCAKHFDAKVTGIDADDAVFPYLHLHAQHNDVDVKTQEKYFEKISAKELANYDVIIGADICFWNELGDVLYNLINRAVKAGVSKIIIADPEREPFFTLADRCMDKGSSKKYNAAVEPWAVNLPRRASGSLLIIESQM